MRIPRIIPHNKPSISEEDIQAVETSLRSLWLAQGNLVKKFEQDLCAYLTGASKVDSLNAIAVSSGTAALFLSLMALGAEPGDEVIIPTYACSALLNAINLTGAKPVIVDICPETWNLSFEETLHALKSKTKAIIITHTFGVPADIERFISLGVPIIEDCAQAIGASIGERKVGTIGEISIFSFYVTKMITTGQGGMVYSADEKLINKVRDYRQFDQRKTYYPRFNFQTTDFQASLGISQLSRIDKLIARRRIIANSYLSAIPEGTPIHIQSQHAGGKSNYYRFVIDVGSVEKHMTWQQRFNLRGIKTVNPIRTWELLHRYVKLDVSGYPNSECISNQTISLPIFPSLEDDEVQIIRSVIIELTGYRK